MSWATIAKKGPATPCGSDTAQPVTPSDTTARAKAQGPSLSAVSEGPKAGVDRDAPARPKSTTSPWLGVARGAPTLDFQTFRPTSETTPLDQRPLPSPGMTAGGRGGRGRGGRGDVPPGPPGRGRGRGWGSGAEFASPSQGGGGSGLDPCLVTGEGGVRGGRGFMPRAGGSDSHRRDGDPSHLPFTPDEGHDVLEAEARMPPRPKPASAAMTFGRGGGGGTPSAAGRGGRGKTRTVQADLVKHEGEGVEFFPGAQYKYLFRLAPGKMQGGCRTLRLVEHDSGACSFYGAIFRYMKGDPLWAEAAALDEIHFSDHASLGKVRKYLDGVDKLDDKVEVAHLLKGVDGVPPTWTAVRNPAYPREGPSHIITPPITAPLPKDLYFVKPAKAGKGQGIDLYHHAEHALLKEDTNYVIQPEVRVKLWKGRKNDWRIFCVVAYSGTTMRGFLCKRGLLRPCSEAYDRDDLTNLSAHLSNRCVQVKSDGFAAEQYDDAYASVEPFEGEILEQMKALFRNALDRVAPLCATNGDKGLVTIGMDVVIDAYGKVWLLEFNQNPGLSFYGNYVFRTLHAPMIEALVPLVLVPLVDPSVPFTPPSDDNAWTVAYEGTISDAPSAAWAPHKSDGHERGGARRLWEIVGLPEPSTPPPPPRVRKGEEHVTDTPTHDDEGVSVGQASLLAQAATTFAAQRSAAASLAARNGALSAAAQSTPAAVPAPIPSPQLAPAPSPAPAPASAAPVPVAIPAPAPAAHHPTFQRVPTRVSAPGAAVDPALVSRPHPSRAPGNPWGGRGDSSALAAEPSAPPSAPPSNTWAAKVARVRAVGV